MLLSAARARVGLNTSDFSLLFAEAAVAGLVLYSTKSQRVGVTPPYLGVLEAVGFHVSNLLVNNGLVGDLLQHCTAESPQSPGSAGQAGRVMPGGEYCQTWR